MATDPTRRWKRCERGCGCFAATSAARSQQHGAQSRPSRRRRSRRNCSWAARSGGRSNSRKRKLLETASRRAEAAGLAGQAIFMIGVRAAIEFELGDAAQAEALAGHALELTRRGGLDE